jgi:hypothetical protein
VAHVVIAYGEWPFTTGEYLAQAMRALGHHVSVMPLQRFRRGLPNRATRLMKLKTQFFSRVNAARWLKAHKLRPDLFLWVESPRFIDLEITRPFPCVTASWVIDTNVEAPRLLELSRQYDHQFVSQKEGTEIFQSAGLAAHWLPLAADPAIHAPQNVAVEFDIGFVGRIETKYYRERYLLLRAMSQRYKVHVATAYGPEMAVEYCRARLGFNKGLNRGLNMRLFEVMAMGRCLLTDLEASGLGDLFKDGTHFVGYSTQSDLFERVDELLANGNMAHTIAEAARTEVLAKHTYRHRAEDILRIALG